MNNRPLPVLTTSPLPPTSPFTAPSKPQSLASGRSTAQSTPRFMALDWNQDGQLSRSELFMSLSVMDAASASAGTVVVQSDGTAVFVQQENAFKTLDANNDGVIDVSEFLFSFSRISLLA
ncbi:MAG: EF-hand domain-containing protein [Cyanobacteria bacterium HKST-UBA06]|nr:EF-hand domain-containing protein [Cyanobacteria bacterium HKST-UBA04]MCA9808352.1 EF-hand domain-containing protein [Cyanobacteria bacterium HKST-UBA06]MCA9842695.1 EF-hand domain-containing protein [Cyanobacteria bacterium HKST-UBA03]